MATHVSGRPGRIVRRRGVPADRQFLRADSRRRAQHDRALVQRAASVADWCVQAAWGSMPMPSGWPNCGGMSAWGEGARGDRTAVENLFGSGAFRRGRRCPARDRGGVGPGRPAARWRVRRAVSGDQPGGISIPPDSGSDLQDRRRCMRVRMCAGAGNPTRHRLHPRADQRPTRKARRGRR